MVSYTCSTTAAAASTSCGCCWEPESAVAAIARVGPLGFRHRRAFFDELDDRLGAGAGHVAFDLRAERNRDPPGGNAAAQSCVGADFQLVGHGDVTDHGARDHGTLGIQVAFPAGAGG